MRVYGNLMNRISEHSLSPTPEIGMGATVYMWSDRFPATVTAISDSGKTITLTEDRVTKWENYYGTEFAPGTGSTWTARKTKNGTWKTLRAGEGVTLGRRSAYRDPSF
jgi:hypothetical protein